MANCCYTEIDIFTEEHCDKLKDLDQKLVQWTEGDWSQKWLGNILINAGCTKKEELESGDSSFRCRGSLVFNEMYADDQLHITTETAWVPMLAMWPAVCEKMGIADAEIVFSAEEPGCEVYLTNDPALLSNPYIFDGYFGSDDEYMISFFDPYNADMHDGYINEESVTPKRMEEVLENARKEIPELKNLEDLWSYLKNGDSYFNIHTYSEAEIQDF